MRNPAAVPPQQQAKSVDAADQQGDVVIPPIRQVLSAELQAYLERIQSLLRDTQALPDSEPGGSFSGWLPAFTGKSLSCLPAVSWRDLCLPNVAHKKRLKPCLPSADI